MRLKVVVIEVFLRLLLGFCVLQGKADIIETLFCIDSSMALAKAQADILLSTSELFMSLLCSITPPVLTPLLKP